MASIWLHWIAIGNHSSQRQQKQQQATAIAPAAQIANLQLTSSPPKFFHLRKKKKKNIFDFLHHFFFLIIFRLLPIFTSFLLNLFAKHYKYALYYQEVTISKLHFIPPDTLAVLPQLVDRKKKKLFFFFLPIKYLFLAPDLHNQINHQTA